jgi:membrane dipeptidase
MPSDRIPFLDLHAHFPMHTAFPPIPFGNPLDVWKKVAFDAVNVAYNYENGKPRVSLEHWLADDANWGVTGFGSVLYDPEDDFFVGRDPIPDAFKHIDAQRTNVEAELKLSPVPVQIAKKPADVEQALKDNAKFIFHTLEGGFSLGGNPGNVKELASRGVASIIPAHLFYRGVSTCENGFPPLAYGLFHHELEQQPCRGLTDLGGDIVKACFNRGVIVDITHARSDAQQDVFDIAALYPGRPVISSHNAVRGICDAGLNLSNDIIRKIARSGGIIGVIFYTQWLRHTAGLDARDDFTLIADVIDYIHCVTGSYEHIGIGSDLDGFIAPIGLCSNYSKMSHLSKMLLAKYGQDVAKLILYQNALRVLYAGWDGA